MICLPFGFAAGHEENIIVVNVERDMPDPAPSADVHTHTWRAFDDMRTICTICDAIGPSDGLSPVDSGFSTLRAAKAAGYGQVGRCDHCNRSGFVWQVGDKWLHEPCAESLGLKG